MALSTYHLFDFVIMLHKQWQATSRRRRAEMEQDRGECQRLRQGEGRDAWGVGGVAQLES